MSTATMDTEELVRLALGGRALKNRRVRRAIIARLINENGESYEGDESEEGDEEETGGEDRELLRVLIGSRLLRRRRMRKALLAHLLRTKSESEGEGEEDGGAEEEEDIGGEGGEGRELVRALIASKVLRRRRFRRALLAHLLRTNAERESAGDSDED